MEWQARPIAVVQGADGETVQRLLRAFVSRASASLRVAGVVEDDGVAAELRGIRDGSGYRLFQDLGSSSIACSLDAASVIDAGQAVCRDIGRGCDLVVLSKFGKLEAESNSGLIPAFVAAIEEQVPILTSVSPRYGEPWAAFAAPLFVMLPPEENALDAWLQQVLRERAEAGLPLPHSPIGAQSSPIDEI